MASPDTDVEQLKTELSQFGIGESRWHWFGRGFLAGLMIIAAVNAISYFVLSDGISNLIGASQSQQEAIGFPFEVWRRGQASRQFLVNFPSFFSNCGIGLLFGIIVGVIAANQKKYLNKITLEAVLREAKSETGGNSLQFSIKSIFIATSIVAVFLAAAMNIRADPKVLAAIFFAGPWAMVGLSMLPPGIKWQHRVVMMTVMAVVMIGVAIAIGGQLDKPFDEVLMGVFISWTPQSVIGILVLLGFIFSKSSKRSDEVIGELDA